MDLALALLQAASIVAVAAVLLASIALYQHYSDEYIVDFHQYLWSVKVAVPPLFVLLATYVIAFFTGSSVSDAPKLALKFVKNRFLQDRLAMIVFISATAIYGSYAVWYVRSQPPPSYEAFVGKLLGGESDGHAIAREHLKRITPLNEVRGRQFETAIAVFEERRRWNMDDKAASVPIAITLVRTLDANLDDSSWANHPLRKHALAEAHSMWFDAAKRADALMQGQPSNDENWSEHGQKAVSLYQEVASSTGPYSTLLMRVSARHNIGNVYLYDGRYTQAAIVFSELLNDESTWNLSTAGNLFVCYLRMGQPEKVLKTAEEVIQRAYRTGKAIREPSSFAGILEAVGFAHLAHGEIKKAKDYYRSVFGLLNDKLSKLNLAMVSALAGERNIGRKLIATAGMEPVSAENLNKRLQSGDTLGCTALIWGVVEDDNPPAAAPYFYGYLGEMKSPADLKRTNPAELLQLKRRAAQALKDDTSPCGDLYRLPMLRARLGVK